MNHDIRDVTRKSHANKLAEAVPTLLLEPPLHDIFARPSSCSSNRDTYYSAYLLDLPHNGASKLRLRLFCRLVVAQQHRELTSTTSNSTRDSEYIAITMLSRRRDLTDAPRASLEGAAIPAGFRLPALELVRQDAVSRTSTLPLFSITCIIRLLLIASAYLHRTVPELIEAGGPGANRVMLVSTKTGKASLFGEGTGKSLADPLTWNMSLPNLFKFAYFCAVEYGTCSGRRLWVYANSRICPAHNPPLTTVILFHSAAVSMYPSVSDDLLEPTIWALKMFHRVLAECSDEELYAAGHYLPHQQAEPTGNFMVRPISNVQIFVLSIRREDYQYAYQAMQAPAVRSDSFKLHPGLMSLRYFVAATPKSTAPPRPSRTSKPLLSSTPACSKMTRHRRRAGPGRRSGFGKSVRGYTTREYSSRLSKSLTGLTCVRMLYSAYGDARTWTGNFDDTTKETLEHVIEASTKGAKNAIGNAFMPLLVKAHVNLAQVLKQIGAPEADVNE